MAGMILLLLLADADALPPPPLELLVKTAKRRTLQLVQLVGVMQDVMQLV